VRALLPIGLGSVAMLGVLLSAPATASPGAGHRSTGPGADGVCHATLAEGEDLYVGGRFSSIDGTPAANIARYDGRRWEALGAGVDGEVRAIVRAGHGLIAAGEFSRAGDVAAANIARWDGQAWHPLGGGTFGGGTNGPIRSLAVQGADLLVAGEFDSAGGVSALDIARWDGAAWHDVGWQTMHHDLLLFEGTEVSGVAFYQGDLYAGCSWPVWLQSDRFYWVLVLRRDEGFWAPVYTIPAAGSTVGFPQVLELHVADGFLYAAGDHLPLLSWNGVEWTEDNRFGEYDQDHSRPVRAVCGWRGDLVVGGGFRGVTEEGSHGMSVRRGQQWEPVPGGGFEPYPGPWPPGLQGSVLSLAEYRGRLVAAGSFDRIGDVDVTAISINDGQGWSSLPVEEETPAGLAIRPNPVRNSMEIVFDAPPGELVRGVVSDASGRIVASIPERSLTAGERILAWQTLDHGGHSLAAGAYWLRLEDRAGTRRVARFTVLR